MWICVDLELIRAANGSLLLPWRGREADLWRQDSHVIWCYLGLEESSAKNGDLLSVKLNSVGLNLMTYWDDTWYGVIFHFSVGSADLVGHLKARLLANSHTLNVGYMCTPLPFSRCFSLHSSMKNLTLKFKREKKKKTGLCLGFSFVICTVTGLVERHHHWVPSPALHSLLWTSRS